MTNNEFFPANEHLAKILRERSQALRFRPEDLFETWRPPCTIRILLVTDGFLGFGLGDFGLSAFVSVLENESSKYGTFKITKAHRNNLARPGEVIDNFKFSNPAHFTQNMYDQVWLFGAEDVRLQMEANELIAIENFMDSGGGLFATGDHGSLGKPLCGDIKRVNQMRRWDNASGEVGMIDSQRNDTNQLGADLRSQFDDQSDDIPQYIFAKRYTSKLGIFLEETYPHPLLCGSNGPINYLPDHPHEGECIVPTDLSDFPGGISPEIIATSLVSGGKTAGGSKAPTAPHSFGAICVYDGHPANVGRVVTDATWHHFTNVNLIGEIDDFDGNRGTTEEAVKMHGFLGSVEGQQFLAQIKEYYINIVLWIARKQNQRCINAGGLWKLVFQHRVMEASMDHPSLEFDKISPPLLYSIGTHASDVLGKIAGQCRKLQSINDGIRPSAPEFVDAINPFIKGDRKSDKTPIPWFDYTSVMSMALGGGILAMRDAFASMDRKEIQRVTTDEILEVYNKGVKKGLSTAFKTIKEDMKEFDKMLEIVDR